MDNQREFEVTAGVVRHTALADAHLLLTYLFQPPTSETADALAAYSVAEDVRQIASELELPDEFEPAARLFDTVHADMAASENALGLARCEYTRVFEHPKQPIIWPYESQFNDAERVAAGQKSTGAYMFVSPTAADVERCYRAAGFKTHTYRVPADCITVELEFMGLLHKELAKALLDADAAAAGRVGQALDDFKARHLLAWAPRFFERCQQECAYDLYRAAGSFGAAVLVAEDA